MEVSQQPIPAHVVVDPPTPGLPSFIQMEQAKASDSALVNLASGDNDKDAKKGKKDDLSKFMPSWMYALGETYNQEDKMNGYGGKVGKYLAQIASAQVLQQGFAKLVTSADSFGGLQYYVEHNKQYLSGSDGIGSLDRSLIATFANWDTGHANGSQAESEEQSELASMQQQGNFLSQHGQLGQSLTKRLQNANSNLVQDGQQVSQVIESLGSGFYGDLH